jgi:hypothetical protein
MVQGYYTLQEAAEVLGMGLDDLKGLAQKNQIRSFQDRGTLRFRIQDIQELQRQRIVNSDPEMVLGDAISPKPLVPPAPKSGSAKTPPRPKSGAKGGDVFDFQLDDSVEIGQEALGGHSSGRRGRSPKQAAPKTPKQGSDSDVKLIADGSDSFSIQLGEDIKPNTDDSDVRLGEITTKKPGSSARKPAGGPRPPRHGQSPADSGVRLVPIGDDSDIQLDARVPASGDSDIRLDKGPPPARRGDDSLGNTEEINLDEELKRHEAGAQKSESKIKTDLAKPGKPASPFELSEHDSDEHPTELNDGSSDFEIAARKTPKPAPRSGAKKGSDFELALGESADDFSLQISDDAIDLGAHPVPPPKSGINLGRPSDKGISLEADQDESTEFELKMDGGSSTPKPSKNQANDPDSEFELSLDDSSAETPALKDEDSEFELSLGESSSTDSPMADSDGDFELALTEETPKSTAKAKSKGKAKPKGSDEGDILETDFELPALDEGSSGDETVDGSSSDFELALDDSDVAPDDESGSQVVALDEEEFEGAEGDIEAVEEGDIEAEEEVREKVVEREVVRERLIKPAPWGALPVAFMVPCVAIMVVVGIMGWELIQTSSGFKSSGVLTRSIADLAGLKVK